jgi:hypothetical protein
MPPVESPPSHPTDKPDDTATRPHRRIGLHHIAFLRGYFEGLDVATLAEQYFDFGYDRKRAQSARRWIVDELVSAARKRGDAAGARLLKLPAGALPSLAGASATAGANTTTPTLDEFRDNIDPDGVYSESELVELFHEAQADAASHAKPDRRASRNARLRSRQRTLLDQLEASLAEPPRLTHRAADWLEPALSQRLEAVGLFTLAQLHAYIRQHGYRWYKKVPRVGEQAAKRLLHWLERNAADLGAVVSNNMTLPRSAWTADMNQQRRQRHSKVAALEYFEPGHVSAQADRDALITYLQRHRIGSATHRGYRVHAERLLLWAHHIRRISLPELRENDVLAFCQFAANPTPREEWVGPKAERGTPQWRPFERGASASTIALSKRILTSIFASLKVAGHIDQNPFLDLRRASLASAAKLHANMSPFHSDAKTVHHAARAVTRAMDVEHKASVATESKPGNTKDHPDLGTLRMQMVLHLLKDSGASLQCLTTLRLDCLQNIALNDSLTQHTHPLTHRHAQPQNIPPELTQTAHASAAQVAIDPFDRTECHLILPRSNGDASHRLVLSASTVHAIQAYMSKRDMSAYPSDHLSPYLIGRQVSVDKEQPGLPMTPNVLARAIKQFIRKSQRATIATNTAEIPMLAKSNARALQQWARTRIRENTEARAKKTVQ